jgi:hypothetical protein
MFARVHPPLSLSVLACLLLSGCATDGIFARRDALCVGDDCVGPQFVQFERGQPHVVVDALGWVWGIPSRILLWDWDVKNHDISPETEQHLREYAGVSGLHDVKVRLNQYDPGGEWQRLAHNDRVGPGWRYTLGALTTLGYTVFPGRIFAIDYYNPFTNTVNVYSDVSALGMKEIAYAGDVIDRDLPGTYAFSQMLPGVNLVHETITTREVLDYVAATGTPDLHRQTVHVLYPSYGGAFGGALDAFLPTAPVFELGGILVGHVSGRWETRGWETDEPLMLSDANTLPGPTEIRVTPPQQFFAHSGAIPIGLSRTADRQQPTPPEDALASESAAPEVAEVASDAGSSEQAESADHTGPSETLDDRDGTIMQASFEESTDDATEHGHELKVESVAD